MKYVYQFHDGDEWITVQPDVLFDDAIEAKKAGILAGFEYVRVILAPTPPVGGEPQQEKTK